MNNFRRTLISLYAVAILLCASATAASIPQASHLLRDLHKASGVPGMAAAVFKDGKLAWHGEAGFANLERGLPVTAQTRFRLASVSKFVTTAMLAQAVERGRMDIKLPLASYFPAFSAPKGAITVQQLATHTSGIPHYDSLRDWDLDDDPRAYRTATEAIHIFKDRPLSSAPGTNYLYSSFGFNLLAATMEQALQTDYPTLLAAFAAQAGVASLQVERPAGSREHFAELYDAGDRRLARGNISNKWAGGGLVSNAVDLAQLGAKLLDPAFLSGKTLQHFLTPASLNNGEAIVGGRFKMGIGWRLGVDHRGRAFFHHSGSIDGGRSHISVFPQEGLVIALLMNTDWVSAMDVTTAVLLDAVRPSAQARSCKSETYRYKGRYQGADIEGTLTPVIDAGPCRLVLSADNALGRWLANGRKTRQFTIHAGPENGQEVLVAPVGLFSAAWDGAKLQLNLIGKPVELQLIGRASRPGGVGKVSRRMRMASCGTWCSSVLEVYRN